LTARAADAFKLEHVEAERIKYRYEIGLRYKTQLNEVYVDVERATEFDETSLAATVARFEERYATVFGAEAGFREAGIELVDFRVAARARSDNKPMPEVKGVTVHREAQRGTRPVHFVGSGSEGLLSTAVYDGDAFPTNLPLVGPALIELSGTTIVVPPDYAVQRDSYGNYILERGASTADAGRTST
jgi:N-methylhydantoinase A